MGKKRDSIVPQADSVDWIGLCPCGCGTYRAALIDANEKVIATFGWDREGWGKFMLGVMSIIDGGSDESVCSHHPTH